MYSRRNIFSYLLILSVFTFVGCGKQKFRCQNQDRPLCHEDSSKANIRFVNTSLIDYCNVSINTSTSSLFIGELKAGQSTCYYAFDEVYRYGNISLTAGGRQKVLQPIDYVGETPLSKGRYAYQLFVASRDEGLSQICVPE